MGLCRKIVELIGLCFLNDADQVGGVCEILVMKDEYYDLYKGLDKDRRCGPN